MKAGGDKLKLFESLLAAGQGHLVDHYHEIGDTELQKSFLQQLEKLDLGLVTTVRPATSEALPGRLQEAQAQAGVQVH